ncbi:hypothetical protein GCM10007103_24000 [Salinimicrobium marinum]|uniref:FAS1 domain-containing protein n=2 Tax=Salinimicrobium marinum TaxID=680283 RepID=A0A918VZX0_9FLAO|nr:hypothetical protein GCM10007103_24000 [Salinimicrobium marinum]
MLVILAGFSSCEKDDDLYPQLGEDPRNISEILSETEDLSTFYQVLTEMELDSTLRSTTTYIVFAPQNEAFANVDLDGLSEEEYDNTILNHLLSTVTADFTSNLTTGYRTTMATGPNGTNLSLFINAEGTPTLNGTVQLVDGSSNRGATNGVLHVVNEVLTPPTILDHLEANPEFSMFLEAVEEAGLTEVLTVTEVTDEENPDYPVTIFAPTNDAFENSLSVLNGALGWESLDDIPAEVLQELLQYHIVQGTNTVSGETPGTEQTTMQGETFSISAQSVISDASYTNANFVQADIQATNGVLHGIDKLLLTEDVFQDYLDETLNIRERLEDTGFSMFLTAAEMTGLSGSLETDELTVFAPNNAAFEAFFGTIENYESLEDFDTQEELDLLRSVLEYHLHSGILLSSQLTDGTLTTVQGDLVTVDTGAGSLTPSHEAAQRANLGRTNIGGTNGVIHEINNFLVSDVDAEALGYPVPSTGGPEFGLEIYHDALNPDFWYGWTEPDFANTENVYSGDQSIRLDYAGYEALQIGNSDGADISGFTTVDFAAYSEAGTSILVYMNGQNSDGVVLTVPAGEWTRFSVPVADISTGATSLTEIAIQDQSGETGTIYYDQIGLDVTGGGNSAPSFDLPVYSDGIQSGFQDTWDGWGGTYTFNSTEVVQNGETSIKLEYFADSWGALQIGGADGVNATDYATFNFSAYGAPGSGTTPLVVGLAGVDDGVSVEVVEGEWTTYSIPVSSFPDTSLGEIRIKNNSAEATTIYIDNIGFNN